MRMVGMGFRAGAPLHSLRHALAQVEEAGGPAEGLSTLAEKAGEAAFVALATERKLLVHPVLDVSGVETPTRSARILALHGTGSVAEATALRAAGAGARMVVARVASPDGQATAAMAESAEQTP